MRLTPAERGITVYCLNERQILTSRMHGRATRMVHFPRDSPQQFSEVDSAIIGIRLMKKLRLRKLTPNTRASNAGDKMTIGGKIHSTPQCERGFRSLQK